MSSNPPDFGAPPDMSLSQIPAKVSESDLENVLRRKVYQAATYDPMQDPQAQRGYRLQREGEEGVVSAAERGQQAALDQEKFLAANKPPETELKTDAPKMADFAKQASPLLMILTTLGGKAMGMNANGMLGAMKGQLDAAAQNNKDAYEQAYKQWEDHWSVIKENQAIKDKAYEQSLKWYKGRVDAPIKAAEFAESIAGEGEKMVGNALQRHTASKEVVNMLEGMTKYHAAAANRHLAGNDAAWNKYLGALEGAADSATTFKRTADSLQSAWQRLEAVVEKNPAIKTEINAGRLLGADLLKRLAEIDSQAVADFNVAAAQNFPAQFRGNVAGIPAGALRR